MKDAICISGIGETEYSRRSGRSDVALAVEAINLALADAGLDRHDVDGLISYYRGVPLEDVVVALGDHITFTCTTHMGGASSVEALQKAALAAQAGEATTTVVYVARNSSSGARIGERVLGRAPGRQFRRQLEHPYGWISPAQWFAMVCRRHMHEFGTTHEQLGAAAVVMRENAQLNPRAIFRERPLTMQDYLASPMIADPLRKADCCLESDGGCAIVLTTPERARDLRTLPVYVSGVAEARSKTPDDIVGRPEWMQTGTAEAADAAFRMAGVGPGDMDVAMLYDCFTFELLHQLEEAGFCPRGESGPFVESGAIARNGSLPVNTHGGLLAEAHMSGMNHVIEAVRQLRGEAGPRQVAEAHWAAVSGWGGTGDATFSVLRTDRA
jgi:acetyl-CoA acetyltransferase